MQSALLTLTIRKVSRGAISATSPAQVGVSTGALDAVCQRASRLLAAPQEALVAYALGSGAINMDETSWFLKGENRTRWTATTPDAAVFRICEDRHRVSRVASATATSPRTAEVHRTSPLSFREVPPLTTLAICEVSQTRWGAPRLA